MAHTLRKVAALTILTAGLSACDDNKNQSTVITPTPAPVAKLEDGFGANFGIAYRADPNTEAKDPAVGDIIPLTLTVEPVPL